MQTSDTIRKALRGVRDPELNLNIIDLGLVYDITISDEGNVLVQMTLTSPGCPAGPEITKDVHDTAADLEGVNSVEVEIVWEPYWTPEQPPPLTATRSIRPSWASWACWPIIQAIRLAALALRLIAARSTGSTESLMIPLPS